MRPWCYGLLLLAAAPLAAQDEYTLFLAEFQKARQYNDDKQMDRQVRSRCRQAIIYYYGLVREWRFGREEDAARARETMDLLSKVWQRTIKTATLDKIERYYSSLDSRTMKVLDQNGTALETIGRVLAEARQSKQRKDLDYVRETCWKLAESYEAVGHGLFAADAWEMAAVAITTLPEISLGERRDAIYALNRYKDLRERWEFTEDTVYKQNMAWLKSVEDELAAAEAAAKRREAAGIKGEARGAEAVLDPNAPAIVADLQFEPVKKPIADCFIQGGEVAPGWMVVEIKKDAVGEFLYFRGAKLYAVRDGLSKYGIAREPELDTALKTMEEIDPANRPKVSEFHLDADKTKPYAMWFFIGGDKEPFMGLEMNLAPDKDRALLYYKSAASWVTQIDGEQVTFFDSNGDGLLFVADPIAFGLRDTAIQPGNELPVPAYDSMQIGKKGTIQPYSEWAKIGDKWFHLKGEKDGAAVSARPVVGSLFPTGKLKLRWTGRGGKPEVLIVRGENERSGAAFNLPVNKEVEVPAGRYTIDYGRIVEGKGKNIVSADIFRGESEPIEVAAGATAVLTLGAPFVVHFEKTPAGADFEVDTHSMRILGAAGEHYAHLNGCVPEADVLLAKDEKGKGAKPFAEIAPVPDPQMAAKLNTEFPKLGYWAPMFPIVKGAKERYNVLRIPASGPTFMAVSAKKAKLFGSLEPVFK